MKKDNVVVLELTEEIEELCKNVNKLHSELEEEKKKLYYIMNQNVEHFPVYKGVINTEAACAEITQHYHTNN